MGNNAPELDQKRSIDIITSAINDTRARMEVNTGAHMLLWGYTLTLTAAAAAIVTLHAATPATTMIWIAVPVAGIIGTRILSRRKPSDYPSNRILKALWWVVGIIAAVIFTLTAHFFTVALLLAVAAIVTGIITREKAVVAAGRCRSTCRHTVPHIQISPPDGSPFRNRGCSPSHSRRLIRSMVCPHSRHHVHNTGTHTAQPQKCAHRQQ